MPIEIRELVIRAMVSEGSPTSAALQRDLARMKQEILEECREQLRELASRNDR